MGKKQNQPLVSVVIPAYNNGEYIKACVDSVFAQFGADRDFQLEVIVVDDGSTDDTAKVLTRYGTSLQYKKIENSGGPARPRNIGIEMAHGDYMAFLDADDTWEPSKLREQLRIMEARPELALLSTNAKMIDSKGRSMNRLVVEKKYVPKEYTFESLLKVNFLSTSGVIVRPAILKVAEGFNESTKLRAVEDYELWLRIAAEEPIALLDEALVGYREHDSKISTADGELVDKRLIAVYKSLITGVLSAYQRKLVMRKLVGQYRALASISGRFQALGFRSIAMYFALRAKLIYN